MLYTYLEMSSNVWLDTALLKNLITSHCICALCNVAIVSTAKRILERLGIQTSSSHCGMAIV